MKKMERQIIIKDLSELGFAFSQQRAIQKFLDDGWVVERTDVMPNGLLVMFMVKESEEC